MLLTACNVVKNIESNIMVSSALPISGGHVILFGTIAKNCLTIVFPLVYFFFV